MITGGITCPRLACDLCRGASCKGGDVGAAYKTDAADALGLAHIMHTGWFKRAHMKVEGTYKLRLLLTHRCNLKRKFLDIENAIRHSLQASGRTVHGRRLTAAASVTAPAAAFDAPR